MRLIRAVSCALALAFLMLTASACVVYRPEPDSTEASASETTSVATKATSVGASAESASTESSESRKQGIYAAWQTLKDPSSGCDAASVLVPDGWTAYINTNWNIVDTGFPCLMTITLLSDDGQAKFVYSSPMKFYQYTSYNSPFFQPSGDDGAYLQNYETRLIYRDAEEYQRFALEINLGCAVSETAKLDTDADGLGKLREEAKKVGDDSVKAVYDMMAAAGQTIYVSLDSYDATVAHNKYTCQSDGAEYVLEAVTSVMQNTTTMTLPSTGLSQTSISWTVLGDCYYVAVSDEAMQSHYAEYQLIRDNIVTQAEFVYLYQRYGMEIRNAITNATTESLREMNERTAGDIVSSYSSEDVSSNDTQNFMENYIFDNDTYRLDDGKTVTVPNSTGGVFQKGDEVFIGNESDAPVGYEKKSVIY